jgi:thiopeptide-type bacteriocin biosynthesis protein
LKTLKYLSIHIFDNDLNRLLKEVVFPFIEKVEAKKQAASYFFIRYSEGGNHIRLRLLTVDEAALRVEIEKYFATFFQNNTIQYIAYAPEIERYGGVNNIAIAEQHFYLSSQTVKCLMSFSENWEDNFATGLSLQLQILFVHAVGFSEEKKRDFFRDYYQNWLPIFEATMQAKQVFQAQFHKARHQATIDFANAFWQDLEENLDFEDAFLADWYFQTKTIAERFTCNGDDQLLKIYESLLHMTNNRLGISNPDEVLLAFILSC